MNTYNWLQAFVSRYIPMDSAVIKITDMPPLIKDGTINLNFPFN